MHEYFVAWDIILLSLQGIICSYTVFLTILLSCINFNAMAWIGTRNSLYFFAARMFKEAIQKEDEQREFDEKIHK